MKCDCCGTVYSPDAKDSDLTTCSWDCWEKLHCRTIETPAMEPMLLGRPGDDDCE
jgi:hypothetical protein